MPGRRLRRAWDAQNVEGLAGGGAQCRAQALNSAVTVQNHWCPLDSRPLGPLPPQLLVGSWPLRLVHAALPQRRSRRPKRHKPHEARRCLERPRRIHAFPVPNVTCQTLSLRHFPPKHALPGSIVKVEAVEVGAEDPAQVAHNRHRRRGLRLVLLLDAPRDAAKMLLGLVRVGQTARQNREKVLVWLFHIVL